ncbi:monosaccharide ABC transporter substrate-binding protein, CUT2 family [Mesorhizobium albiziae]|uniref:Monosaccharide ABC transporter substrate-binding protein, CUT2 family n=1 Tax=Neomesorhizobium albiziae TaxID=335020 RepID=A0A1I4D6P5_9HYPH|nr:substrate-binding domain-containing protein [Mesorhizobium albiziae]GLS33671.1 D-ribose ABC transporter substrate-binding protein [Mesorhizobium albiziae]SFK88673.1 monosaccharide ABC transporter substrate-binding protein, CUT2 family [Mesorhizobium albiziae]
MSVRTRYTAAAACAVAMTIAGLGTGFAEEKVKIGFSQGTMESSWRVNMVEGNKKYAEANLPDVDLIVTNGENQASKQVSDVESLISQGVKTLIISPVTADALTPVVKQAMDAGIPVVTLDRKVNTDVTLHIGADNVLIGKTAGEFVCQTLGGKGNVIEIQGTAGASATVDRHDAFHKVLAEKCPDVKVVADQVANYVREPAIKFMEDMLQRFKPGEIQLVYAHNDDMALGAVTALEAANRLSEVKVVGIDGENAAYDAIKAGKMVATFTYHFVAPEGVQYGYKVAKGEKLDKEIVLPTHQVDATNVDDWIGKGF